MSGNPSQVPTTSMKAVNIPSQPVSATFTSSSFDSGSPRSQRRPGGSGSFGAGLTSQARNSGSPRNNQALKSQHRRQRRPRLLDDDDYSESAIMRSTTSRKGQTSITHLMNFSLPPRPQYNPPPRNNRRYTSWGPGSGYHAMDKSRYVHANYRFIVAPNRNYHAQAANADVHLDWDSVLQVLVSAQTQSASCPICLSTPVAPRMARCGHIFCLSCLIRYMHSTDEENPVPEKKPRWKKCPICWDSIYVSETRPVRWFRGQEGDLPFEGGDVVLRLVKREPGSTLALPRDGAEDIAPEEDVPWYHAAEVADYARIMKGGEDYMKAQYDIEIEELRRQELEDELLFGDDTTWTQKAVAAIRDAKTKIEGIGNPPDITRQPVQTKKPKEPIALQSPPEGVAAIYESQHATKSGQSSSAESIPASDTGPGSASTPGTSNGLDRTTEALGQVDLNSTSGSKKKQRDPGHGRNNVPSTRGPHTSDHSFFFYQALPQFYLSPLDIRILKAAFGDYSSFPATILPRVERISTGHIVDEELRKRVKYLSHLPQGCEVNFLECDWRDVVVPEVLETFKSETERRRKRNKEKEAREEKDRIRAEKKEDEERWAAARRKRPSIDTINDPPFSDRDFQPLAGATGEPPGLDIESSSASPPQPSHFGALASTSTSPPGSRTVWGTTAVPALSAPSGSQPGPADGWLQGWEEELWAQQERELMAQSAAEASNPTPSASGGKKKKNKKITLMATNIQRGA
ncbi:RING-type E3 ubiquitin transferase MAG2 [Aspergillus ibericus CBS 121593]|uniref:RING finger domain protein n=1 Tax=Aspergillus ibericus CBS 121593 TaxID=1448316 RepID=A0A395HB98_9EURO|nr:RING finger domain protein [Aspergillus ibericus CBS 121593]RAL04960.1 RING finger domain protein [Aspergillus ibericus CBS 121593]